jgi:spore coat polysaccharide biosynthesis predicted glycosyltransferase SpsG
MENNNYKFLCYASGGNKIGYGHLYRLARIIEKFDLVDQSIFLFTNSEEKFFLKNRGLNIFSGQNILPEKIIIDSRIDSSDLLDKFSNVKNNSIILDNLDDWASQGDNIIIPSFFINDKLKEKFENKFSKKVLYGKKFSIPPSPTLSKKNINDNILITFGGSDPNNITLKVVELLSDSSFAAKLKIILGPGYSHSERKIYEFVSKNQILRNVKNLSTEIANSAQVITALGTTIQHIEFYGKKSIIVCNYDNDKYDFRYIRKYCQNESYFNCLGNWKNIKKKSFLNSLNELELMDELPVSNSSDWGSGWKNLLSN